MCGTAWVLSTTSMRMLDVILSVGLNQKRWWIKFTPQEREERNAKRARTAGEWSGHEPCEGHRPWPSWQPARASTWQPARAIALGHRGTFHPCGKYNDDVLNPRSDPSREQTGNEGKTPHQAVLPWIPVSCSHSQPWKQLRVSSRAALGYRCPKSLPFRK